MRLKISEKNSKIGKLPNLSLPPGTSCVKGIPCYTEGCYAQNSYRMYPNVREAWGSNLEFYKEDPDQFFAEFYAWLRDNRPERFRLFVGGDFPDETFYRLVERTVYTLNTKFLVFTKRYDYDFSGKPDNLNVVLSTWPGVDLPKNTDLPWSWLQHDERRPKNGTYIVCPGGCDECAHKCWDIVNPELHVVFPKH